MRHLPPLACCIAAALALGACGGPVAPAQVTKAAAPAPPATATAAILNPKGTIDAARDAAGAASAGVVARQAAAQVAQPERVGSVAAPAAVASAAAPALNPPEPPKYEANGRRDPFEPLDIRLGSERSTVSAAKLTGILNGGAGAMALVETSDGIGYILKLGDTLADGRVTEIGVNVVVFAIAPKPGVASNRVVLKLATD